jgi:asparagine synthetase B (glutamine-hydrolysing)
VELTFKCDVGDPIALFYDGDGRIAEDATSLAGARPCVDGLAAFSVLQVGTIVPPLSPWQGVQRIMPGFHYEGTTPLGPIEVDLPQQLASLSTSEQLTAVESLIDNVLLEIIGDGPDPIVLFSGGVDSGIIASRLARLGRRDTLLLNYSFGNNDPESQLAEAMAKALGLPFERIAGTRHPCSCLEQPGAIFQQPFADISTAPTTDLAYAVIDRLAGNKRPILNGIGADGIFGLASLIRSWDLVQRVPAAFRRLASAFYGWNLWKQTSKLEYYCRIARRSVTLPPVLQALALNPLSGILYRRDLETQLHEQFESLIERWGGDSISRNAVTMASTSSGGSRR